MSNKILAILFFVLLITPISALAMEQSFTQNGVTTTIRLSPDQLTAGKPISLIVKVEHDGQAVIDRQVTLEVYEEGSATPVIKRGIDVLDQEFVESWTFDKPGDYKVMLNISDPHSSSAALRYEVKASVGPVNEGNHEEHGFFKHHLGSHWGWWGGGLMLLMMVPMMILL